MLSLRGASSVRRQRVVVLELRACTPADSGRITDVAQATAPDVIRTVTRPAMSKLAKAVRAAVVPLLPGERRVQHARRVDVHLLAVQPETW